MGASRRGGLASADYDAVIGGYVAPGSGGFASFNASAGPFSDPTWALVSTGTRL